ncbi:MAG: acyl-CoA desaturase [Planctomycetia bacterium]|nr:acyl-CoA desaturase [Planctomycetia bacterium]
MNDAATLQACVQYAKELRADIPQEAFQRNPWRLLWLPVHLAIIGGATTLMLATEIHWGWRLALSAVIGHSYGVLMFLAHEILHGSVVKNARLQNWISGLCMLPYCIGPAHWKAWHNRAHHGHTSQSGADPDSFGNVTMFICNRVARFMLTFAPGSGYRRSWLFLGFWFSFHAITTLFLHSQRYDYWNAARRRRQIALFFAMVAFWAGVAVTVGMRHFLFLYVLPIIVANMLQMSYIATNHLFCDETEDVNDPLANSLSVSVPKWLGWLHLNFGYHIEHHIYPYMNPRHAPRVRAALEARYGRRYRSLPILTALRVLYETPPVHLSQKELVDLDTGAVFSTLGVECELPRQIDRVTVPVRPRRTAAALRLLKLEGSSPAIETSAVIGAPPAPATDPADGAARKRAA